MSRHPRRSTSRILSRRLAVAGLVAAFLALCSSIPAPLPALALGTVSQLPPPLSLSCNPFPANSSGTCTVTGGAPVGTLSATVTGPVTPSGTFPGPGCGASCNWTFTLTGTGIPGTVTVAASESGGCSISCPPPVTTSFQTTAPPAPTPLNLSCIAFPANSSGTCSVTGGVSGGTLSATVSGPVTPAGTFAGPACAGSCNWTFPLSGTGSPGTVTVTATETACPGAGPSCPPPAPTSFQTTAPLAGPPLNITCNSFPANSSGTCSVTGGVSGGTLSASVSGPVTPAGTIQGPGCSGSCNWTFPLSGTGSAGAVTVTATETACPGAGPACPGPAATSFDTTVPVVQCGTEFLAAGAQCPNQESSVNPISCGGALVAPGTLCLAPCGSTQSQLCIPSPGLFLPPARVLPPQSRPQPQVAATGAATSTAVASGGAGTIAGPPPPPPFPPGPTLPLQPGPTLPPATVTITGINPVIITIHANQFLDFTNSVTIDLPPGVQATGVQVSTGAATIQGSQVVWKGFTLNAGQEATAAVTLAVSPGAVLQGSGVPVIQSVSLDALDMAGRPVHVQAPGGGPDIPTLAAVLGVTGAALPAGAGGAPGGPGGQGGPGVPAAQRLTLPNVGAGGTLSGSAEAPVGSRILWLLLTGLVCLAAGAWLLIRGRDRPARE